MQEIWKDIPNFEDSYQVSNLGRFRAKERKVRTFGGAYRTISAGIRKPNKCKNGYYEVFCNRAQKRQVFLLHRLVAQVFIPNPNNLPEVNHKDEDITNCRADNLEWCTSKYNANYGTRTQRCIENNPQKRPVNQYTKDGRFIKRWRMINDAARHVGVDGSAITRVCKGKQHTSMGYVWRYAD